MASTASSELIPESLDDISSIAAIECLETAAFATLIPRAMRELSLPDLPIFEGSDTPFGLRFSQLVRQRATDPAVVSAISLLLTQPLISEADVNVIHLIVFKVIHQLPYNEIFKYRQALMVLSKANSNASSDPRYTGSLVSQAQTILRFIDNPEDVWVPNDEDDQMGKRTLKERVHTARDMRPHVDGLLRWLQDRNLPLYVECEAQLARFPEIAIMPIRKIFIDHRGGGEWANNLLHFVQDHVPVGRSWEAMYPQVEALLNYSKGNKAESKTAECAADWIWTLERWRGSQEGLRCA